jgi:hypothetical protein
MSDFPLSLSFTVLLLGVGSLPMFAVALGVQVRYLPNETSIARGTWPRFVGFLLLWLTVALVVTDIVFTVMPPAFLTAFDRVSPLVLRALVMLLVPSTVGAAAAVGVTTWLAKRVGRRLTHP